MKKKRIIFVDGLDYEKHLIYMPYLSSLKPRIRKSRFGYENFLGEDRIAKFYFTNNSSWRWIRNFIWLPRFLLEILLNLQMLFQDRPFFRTYYIPKKLLPYLDTNIEKHSFYKEFHKLDKLCHKYGVEHPKVIKYLRKLDKWLQKHKWDKLISDHGMREVIETINPPEIISPNPNSKFFIDSTFIREWDGNDDSYGKIIIKLKPGQVFSKSYWYKSPPKSMHGWGSDDNQEYAVVVKKNG